MTSLSRIPRRRQRPTRWQYEHQRPVTHPAPGQWVQRQVGRGTRDRHRYLRSPQHARTLLPHPRQYHGDWSQTPSHSRTCRRCERGDCIFYTGARGYEEPGTSVPTRTHQPPPQTTSCSKFLPWPGPALITTVFFQESCTQRPFWIFDYFVLPKALKPY